MKLHYIVEEIQDVRKYYPNITDDIFIRDYREDKKDEKGTT